MKVVLSWQEQLFASIAGCMRRISALARRRHEPYGTPSLPAWDVDINSAAAEMAVAKAIGSYWSAVVSDPSTLPGDVGNIQVRSTARPNGRLILHDRDGDAAVFVLVRGEIPEFEVAGWIRGADGKRAKYMQPGDGRAAYFVPAEDLHSMKDFIRIAR